MSPNPLTVPTASQHAGFEEAFERETRELLGQRFRLSFSVGIVLYLAFSGLDWFFANDRWETFLILRCTVAALAGAAIFASSTKWGERHVLPLSFATLSLASGVLSVMTALLDGFSSSYFYGNMLVLFLVGLFMPWRPGVTLAFCSVVTGGYFIANFWVHSLGLTALLPFFFLLGTCALTFMGSSAIERSRRRDLWQRLQLSAANEQLQGLDEAKTQFFTNVSHELRTPLMLILGPLERLLANAEQGGQDRALLESMEQNGHRLLRQINMILNFAKLESGKVEAEFETSNVGDVLLRLVRSAGAAAEARDLRLDWQGLDELPNSLFDIEKIETVASNLLGNAMKFTQAGDRISVRAGADAHSLWFEVEDTGRGISDAQQARVFERFHQAPAGEADKVQGTGLGLSLAHEFVRMHDGEIQLRSKLGVGTLFRVELPLEPTAETLSDGSVTDQSAGVLAQAEHVEHGEAESDSVAQSDVDESNPSSVEGGVTFESSRSGRITARGSEKTAFADLAGPRLQQPETGQVRAGAGLDAPLILVVEDNDDMRAFIASSLESNYRVATARDGFEGLEQAKRLLPSLIVSDVMMPRLDGMNMLRQLREIEATKDLPVVFVTARTGTEAVVQGLKLGAVDYVTKPFKLTELEARIETHLTSLGTQRKLDERDSRLTAVGLQAGKIAHDLRTPLASISLRSEAIKRVLRAESADEIAEDLISIRASVKKADLLVTDLLDFSKGKQIEIQPQLQHVQPFLNAQVDQVADALASAGIEVSIECHPPDLRASFDDRFLGRVFDNLLRNAQEAMATSGQEAGKQIWLSATAIESGVKLRIADNGPGIPDSLRYRVFDDFATEGKRDGTGLGLSICRNFVQAHGGEIYAEDRPAEGGAAFCMELKRDDSFWASLLSADEEE